MAGSTTRKQSKTELNRVRPLRSLCLFSLFGHYSVVFSASNVIQAQIMQICNLVTSVGHKVKGWTAHETFQEQSFLWEGGSSRWTF